MPVTAREKIAGVLRWAEQQQLHNVAAELRSALLLLGDEPAPAASRRSKKGR